MIGIAASVDAQRRKATLATYGDGCGVTQLSRYAQRKLRVGVNERTSGGSGQRQLRPRELGTNDAVNVLFFLKKMFYSIFVIFQLSQTAQIYN